MGAQVTIKGHADIAKMAHSDELSEIIASAAVPIYREAQKDPDEFYVATLRFYRHDSNGRRGRVSWRIGAHPVVGPRVEATRGTLARAVGRVGK